MYVALIFLSFLQSVIGFTLMASSTMKFKEPIKKRIILGLSVMIGGILLLTYTLYARGTDSVDRFAILVILGISLSWYLICAKDRFFVSLFSFLSFVNIYVSISFISDNLSYGFTGISYMLVRFMIRLLIYLIILPLLYKYVRKRFKLVVETLDKEWKAANIVPFMFLVIQIMVLYYPVPYWRWVNNSWSRVIIISVYFLFLAVYYLLSVQATAIVDKYGLEKRHLLMAQQEKLWEAELQRQKQEIMLANQQRHDMHHHNTVIMDLLQRSDLTTLKQYLINYDETLDSHYSELYCQNPIANSILNFYAKQARQENIKTNFNVLIPEVIGIDHVDLTCILGNALENAFEGCLALSEEQEREINVTAKFFDKRLRVQVTNTCDDVIFDNDLPVSKKEGGGTGTKSILYTAERYDGTAGFTVMDGKFISQIVLNVK
ncbi:MAG: GHKL domain-containing protein [Erysipelothrix sp.]|jgi:hypothetical protein|nr:GHKL domain-containing protein [Erysipelothrix sp.]